MSTIPASTIVSVNPGVLSAGGSSLDLNGLMLSASSRVPIGSVQSFPDQPSVADYFGEESIEASMATNYFAGFVNATKTAGAMLVTQYNDADVGAFLRGGDISTMSIATLQGITGTLSVTIDGVLKTGSPDLSGATSFTAAADLIADTLGLVGPQVATFTGSIATTTLTVTAVAAGDGKIGVGMVLHDNTVADGTYILAQLTSTETDGHFGGKGTYSVSDSQTVGSGTIHGTQPAVTFDSVSGGLIFISPTVGASSTITFGSGAMATSLKLTNATGAVISQGAVAASPQPFMSAVSSAQRNWASFFSSFDPDAPDEISVRLEFAQWASLQNFRYVYVVTDSDVAPTESNSAPASLGAQIKSLGYASCSVNWQPSETNLAAVVSGFMAAINFDQVGGRITFNGRRQEGVTPGVTDETAAANLEANGYNYYGAWGTANDEFQQYANGSVSGSFTWLDSQVNAIWLTNQFQLDLMELLQNTFSIPYNAAGNAMIEVALSPTIQQGLDFGMYRAGVTLSGAQKSAVNALAGGLDVASALTNQGWYLYIGTASSNVRQNRGSPPITFFYMDGEAVQKLNVSTLALL